MTFTFMLLERHGCESHVVKLGGRRPGGYERWGCCDIWDRGAYPRVTPRRCLLGWVGLVGKLR